MLFANAVSDGITGVIAVLAFLISLYTLWATHLKPFRPLFLLHEAGLRFVRFEQRIGVILSSREERWREVPAWGPMVDLSLTVVNGGVQPGQILDFRMVFASDEFVWAVYPRCIADRDKLRASFESEQAEMKHPGVICTEIQKAWWSGLYVSKGNPVTAVVVLIPEQDTFCTIPVGKFRGTLEYWTPSAEKWQHIHAFEFDLDEDMKAEMENGECCGLWNETGNRERPAEWQDTRKVLLDKDKVVEGLRALN